MDVDFEFPATVIPGQLIAPEIDVKEVDDKTCLYKYNCGPGTKLITYQVNGKEVKAVTATLVGETHFEDDLIPRDAMDSEQLQEEDSDDRVVKNIKISVTSADNIPNRKVNHNFANSLPQEGDTVLAKVTRISLQRANMEILAVENVPSPIDGGVGSNGHGVVAAGGGSGHSTYSVAQTSSDFGEPFRGILRSQDVRATERDSVKMIENFKPGDIVRAQILSLGDGTNYYLTTAKNTLGVVFAKSLNGEGEQMYAIDWQTMIAPNSGVTEKRKCARPF